MIRKCWAVLLIVLVLACGFTGIKKKSTYTDISADPAMMDTMQIAELPEELSEATIKDFQEKLQNARYIFRVTALEPTQYLFHTARQKVMIQEIYQDKMDDAPLYAPFYLISDGDMVYTDDRTVNTGFVNELQPGKSYLVFLEEQILTRDKSTGVTNYRLMQDFMIDPVFCYEDLDTKVIPIKKDADNTYIPYQSVKKNEFFLASENAMKKMLAFKHELLKSYPAHTQEDVDVVRKDNW